MGSCFGYHIAAAEDIPVEDIPAAEDIPVEDTLAGDNPEEDTLGERIVEAGLRQAVLDCSNSSFTLFLNLLREIEVKPARRAKIAKRDVPSFAWTSAS